jgi:hypothetical protein
MFNQRGGQARVTIMTRAVDLHELRTGDHLSATIITPSRRRS